jgi:hypothetical protein
MTEGTLKVNFSDQEASSEAKSFDPIPSGKYPAYLTDVELAECGPNSKNSGKPYWKLEFTVDGGPADNRKLWSNCMLFSPALYTLTQLLKAAGYNVSAGEMTLPDPDELIGKRFLLNVKKQRDTYAEERDGDGTPQFKNEIKTILTDDGAAAGSAPAMTKASAAAGSGSILP